MTLVKYLTQKSAPRLTMTTSEQRLKTFVNWPHSGTHAPVNMAAAGWLHDNNQAHGHKDAAQCFNCDLALVGWKTAQNPFREHLERSPHCTWILSKTMNTQEKREDTFANWPFDEHHDLSYMRVAAAGFFQSDPTTHTVTCHACQLTLGPQQLGTDPLAVHMRLDNPNSPCAYLIKVTENGLRRHLANPKKAHMPRARRSLPTVQGPQQPKHRCGICRNVFSTQDGLARHMANPKHAHGPRLRKVPSRRAVLPRRAVTSSVMPRRVVASASAVSWTAGRKRVPASRVRRVNDLASRITRPQPEYIKIEDE